MNDPRRRIPSVDALLAAPPFRSLVERAGRARVVEAARAVQDSLRTRLATGEAGPGGDSLDLANPAWYAERVEEHLARVDRRALRGVINATGVVLHTNLGRAPLARSAERAVRAAAGYVTLEYDLEEGARGGRDQGERLLRELTGAESALVVNNNAAAVVLALNTLAEGRGAVISRGELVEIGGSFRVPEIMARSGARMVEVGSTNRTHLRDYREALAVDIALILKVHRSNFRVEGFTAEVDAAELARLAAVAEIPLVHDLGSGAILDLTEFGLPAEPTAAEALGAGADVVTMSGDKLLGGPQAGIVLGRAELLDRMRANPLFRAFRCDKLTLAALEATLSLYREGRALDEIPVLRMLSTPLPELRRRAEWIAEQLRAEGVRAELVQVTAAVGGGAYPEADLPGVAVAVSPHDAAERLARRLRLGDAPVIGRIREGQVLLDPRTVPAEQDAALVRAVSDAVKAVGDSHA